MSETHAPQGDRRRRQRRPQSGRPRNRDAQRGPRPRKAAKQSALEKFLSIVTFGLIGGKKKTKLPERKPTSNVTVVTSKPRGEGRQRAMPPAEPESVTTPRLYVGNLSYDAGESDLFELFNGVGSVSNAEVVVNNRTQRSKGFAFVTMASVEEARRAVSELHGKDFMGRPLQVNGAKPSTSRDDDSGEDNDQEAA
jgi:RNA recognition motif-containing protein